MTKSEKIKNLWKNPEYRENQIKKRKGQIPWNKGKIPEKSYRRKHSMGYCLILSEKHPYKNKVGYVPEHRLVMEKKIGRYINPKKEHVHHIDKDKKNNNIKNLILLTPIDHIRIHQGWKKVSNKWFKKCRKCNQFLEVNKNNFYFRSNKTYFHNCIVCARKTALAYYLKNL